jgi:exopolysaccharide biosynthesis polyprenyl glycosylphosphotransferase
MEAIWWKPAKVSIPYRNPASPEAHAAVPARMIPAELPFRGRKPPQPLRQVRSTTGSAASKLAAIGVDGLDRTRASGLALLWPLPLLKRTGRRWARATAADFALVALNWLLLGALLVPLRTLFPQIHVFAYDSGAPASLLGIALLHAALISLMGCVEGLYDGGDLPRQARALGKSVLWATGLLSVAYGLQSATWATIVLFCGVGALNFGALWAWRWQSEKRQKRTVQVAHDVRHVLIVGAGAAGRRVAAYVNEHRGAGRSICGFLDDEKPLGDEVIGRVSDLARLARTGFVDEVILAAPHDRKVAEQVLREAQRMRLNVGIIPELYGCMPVEDEMEHVGGVPLICLRSEPLPAGLGLKRLVDIVGAGLALLSLSPLLAAISLLIKLDSPGPVFYRALRAGRKGRPFRCCKFRTMVSDADSLKERLRKNNQRTGPFFKIANDPRITRLGRFLRRYSLDEFPQFWNVLQGAMSLVGPRPHPLDDLAGYEVGHLARLDVTPGMTGLWQVTARRDPSFERGMELDREYIRTWSLGADLRILLKTFRAVLQGSGD